MYALHLLICQALVLFILQSFASSFTTYIRACIVFRAYRFGVNFSLATLIKKGHLKFYFETASSFSLNLHIIEWKFDFEFNNGDKVTDYFYMAKRFLKSPIFFLFLFFVCCPDLLYSICNAFNRNWRQAAFGTYLDIKKYMNVSVSHSGAK